MNNYMYEHVLITDGGIVDFIRIQYIVAVAAVAIILIAIVIILICCILMYKRKRGMLRIIHNNIILHYIHM